MIDLLLRIMILIACVRLVRVLLIVPLTILRVRRPGCEALAHTFGWCPIGLSLDSILTLVVPQWSSMLGKIGGK